MMPAFVVASVILFAGCTCGHKNESSTVSQGTRETADDSVTAIEGTVRLADGAELPSYAVHPLVAPHGRPAIPQSCPPPQRADAQPVQQGEHGLSGVLVALHDFSSGPPHEPQIHRLTIRDCRLEPRLVAATRGDRLLIENETNYPFLPNFGGGMMQAILHQQNREVELGAGGIRSLECGFAAPCGRAEVITLYHPLHDVTDPGGTFRIEGVPAGEQVRVSAWHPLFREASQSVTVAEGQTARVELVLEPAPPPPAVEAPQERGPAENDPSQLF